MTDTGLFHQIDDAHVVVYARGVYKQVKLYQRDGLLYAGHGSGFIALFVNGNTSLPNASWKNIVGYEPSRAANRIAVAV